VVPPAGSASPGAGHPGGPAAQTALSPALWALYRAPIDRLASYVHVVPAAGLSATHLTSAGPVLCSPAGDATPLGHYREGADRSTGPRERRRRRTRVSGRGRLPGGPRRRSGAEPTNPTQCFPRQLVPNVVANVPGVGGPTGPIAAPGCAYATSTTRFPGQ
jgi:hypothetical protein